MWQINQLHTQFLHLLARFLPAGIATPVVADEQSIEMAERFWNATRLAEFKRKQKIDGKRVLLFWNGDIVET